MEVGGRRMRARGGKNEIGVQRGRGYSGTWSEEGGRRRRDGGVGWGEIKGVRGRSPGREGVRDN